MVYILSFLQGVSYAIDRSAHSTGNIWIFLGQYFKINVNLRFPGKQTDLCSEILLFRMTFINPIPKIQEYKHLLYIPCWLKTIMTQHLSNGTYEWIP